ncbi:hypothetical protein ACS0TY_016418 [Phlomoides rotata]
MEKKHLFTIFLLCLIQGVIVMGSDVEKPIKKHCKSWTPIGRPKCFGWKCKEDFCANMCKNAIARGEITRAEDVECVNNYCYCLWDCNKPPMLPSPNRHHGSDPCLA